MSNTTANVHIFEAAGLGKYPFTFVGVTKKHDGCQYCGTAIVNRCHLLSADGRSFYVGNDCITKSGDRGLATAVKTAVRDAAKAVRAQARKDAESKRLAALAPAISAFLAQEPDLPAILQSTDPIITDIQRFLHTRGYLTPGQLSLVRSIHAKLQAIRAEINVPAPEGRVSFDGTIVGLKYVHNRFSYNRDATIPKITVKVQNAAGETWLVFMTAPSGLDVHTRGTKVSLTATLAPSDSPHFAFGSRPVVNPVNSKVTK